MSSATAPSITIPNVEELRKHFPSLESGFAYMENAGGSQVPACVPNAMRDYMLSTYVQTGAGYAQSTAATENMASAHALANMVMGGEGIGKAILGPSTTALTHILAGAYRHALPKGCRIIAAETGHEANIGPWANLSKDGFDFRLWKIDPKTLQCPLEGLERLLEGGDAKIVAFPHVSNLLGEIVDVAAITELAHRYGARTVVDGVAYAPHRLIDVAAWGVDWYAFSWYKVFGPHMSAMFGTSECLGEVIGPNHFFIPRDSAYKFELGGITHEGCAGLNGLRKYLNVLAGRAEGETVTRAAVSDAFGAVAALEVPLQQRYIEYLGSKDGVRIVGPAHGEPSRVCTISFLHETMSSPEIVSKVHERPIGIRSGNAYAYRLCQALGIDPISGVVRASFAHYNTLEEVDRLIEALDYAC